MTGREPINSFGIYLADVGYIPGYRIIEIFGFSAFLRFGSYIMSDGRGWVTLCGEGPRSADEIWPRVAVGMYIAIMFANMNKI